MVFNYSLFCVYSMLMKMELLKDVYLFVIL